MQKRAVRPEWHPAIKAMGWVTEWGWVALSAAIVIEFLVSGRALPSYLVRIGARAAVLGAAMALATPLLPAMEVWWSGVQHARREYRPRFAKQYISVLTAIVLVVVGIYALLPIWLLPWMWRRLTAWAATIDPIGIGARGQAGWVWTIVLLAGCAFFGWFSSLMAYVTVRNYGNCVRRLGVRHTLRGVAMMILLRLRQPRREFFKMTPVIGDMLPLALAIGLYLLLPVSVLSNVLLGMFVAMELSISLDRIRPPTWLFLGTTDYEAFWVFDDLRAKWGVTAVCLLDRSSETGYEFYAAEREKWSREGRMPRGVFYDPGQPRIWNLRTRPNLWQHTVLLLIDYVPTVVVDLRRPSAFVAQEVRWLAEPSRAGKPLFLVDEREGLLPEYAELIPESARDRVMTGHALYELPHTAAGGPMTSS